MFNLTDRPRVWIAVTWPGLAPGKDEGLAETVDHEIEVEIEIVEAATLAELFPPEGLNSAEFREVFKRLTLGWRKFQIEGKTAEFNDENIAKILSVPMFAQGFELAYMKAWQGKGESRTGNSEGSPAPGRAASSKRKPKPSSS